MEIVSEFVLSIASNPWINIFGFLITLLGLIFAVIFYKKSQMIKIPCYILRGFNIVHDISNILESLEMSYEGKSIDNLRVTKLGFWNAGEETIHDKDIPTADPLQVKVRNKCRILDAKITYKSNIANDFSITELEDENNFNINFDYLDKDDGAIIQIVHTGTSNNDIEVYGSIKGVKSLHNVTKYLIRSITPVGLVLVITVWIFLYGWLYSLLTLIERGFLVPFISKNLLTSVFILPSFGVFYFYFLKRRIPKGFESVEEII